MGYRGWFTQVNPENLAEFRDDIRRNPNAYGIYYVIDIAADIQLFRKGLWAAWAGDGDGSLSRDMPAKYLTDTVYLDDVLEKYPEWRADPGRYGRCDYHVTAGGLSLAEGAPDKYPPWQKPENPDLEDWFLWAEEGNAMLDAELNQPPVDESIEHNLDRLDKAMDPVLDRRNESVEPKQVNHNLSGFTLTVMDAQHVRFRLLVDPDEFCVAEFLLERRTFEGLREMMEQITWD